jgi:hypothetical protein
VEQLALKAIQRIVGVVMEHQHASWSARPRHHHPAVKHIRNGFNESEGTFRLCRTVWANKRGASVSETHRAAEVGTDIMTGSRSGGRRRLPTSTHADRVLLDGADTTSRQSATSGATGGNGFATNGRSQWRSGRCSAGIQ